VSSSIIKQMLPLIAGLLMGGLSRQANSGGLLGQAMGGGDGIGSVLSSILGGGVAEPARQPEAGSGILGLLGPLLDQNRNGSALDDVLGMASQFLTRAR
jgi:hypothetical protein